MALQLVLTKGIYSFFQREDRRYEVQLPDGRRDVGLTLEDVHTLGLACLQVWSSETERERHEKEIQDSRTKDLPGFDIPV